MRICYDTRVLFSHKISIRQKGPKLEYTIPLHTHISFFHTRSIPVANYASQR